jgi:thiol:disulfide interchange protein/DsbC/DsbD-like thiol-disulfide interchange protein
MRLISVLLLLHALLFAPVTSAAPQRFDHLSAELVAEQREVAPGSTVTVALRLLHDEGWHTYWVNPGDAGIETRFRWTLPEGVSAGPVQWPVPKHFDIGGVHNLGYKDETWLLVDLAVADSVAAGQTLPVGLEASWLVCEEACIPGKGNFSINLAMDLAVASQSSADTMLRPAFAKAREHLPRAAPADWQASFELGEKDVGLLLEGPLDALTGAKRVELFVATPSVVAYAPPAIGVTAERIGSRIAKNDYYSADPERIELLWVGNEADGSRVGYRIEASRVAQLAAAIPTPANLPDGPTVAAGGSGPPAPALGLGWALLFAVAGGLILNLMPCVFPVLSLKALSLAESGANDHHARSHSLWYTAGVLLSFMALGLAVILLREAGQALGWGFQLQSPWFVAGLVYLFVVLGLSLSGAISIGNRITGFGQSLTEGEGARSAFFTGVLACVVASPCTAPFMGSALGYAFTLPTVQALLIFLALGLGLALPFLLIGFVPGLARRLPRPGRWMETLKQALAFPLYLSAVWLLWVLGQQVGIDGAALALVGVIVLIFALWWLERVADDEGRGRIVHQLLAAAVAAAALYPVMVIARGDFAAPAQAAAQGRWEPYSAARLAELRAAGTPVLIDMTAAWCATCKVNERIALSSERFFGALEQNGVVAMKGDWTDYNAEITAFLQEFGAAGVPLYVVYPRGSGKPEVLPQVLTPDLVLRAIDKAAAGG